MYIDVILCWSLRLQPYEKGCPGVWHKAASDGDVSFAEIWKFLCELV